MCFSIQQDKSRYIENNNNGDVMMMMKAVLCVLFFGLFVYKLKPEARRICLHLFRDTAA